MPIGLHSGILTMPRNFESSVVNHSLQTVFQETFTRCFGYWFAQKLLNNLFDTQNNLNSMQRS